MCAPGKRTQTSWSHGNDLAVSVVISGSRKDNRQTSGNAMEWEGRKEVKNISVVRQRSFQILNLPAAVTASPSKTKINRAVRAPSKL